MEEKNRRLADGNPDQDLTVTRLLAAPRRGRTDWPLRVEVIGGPMDGTQVCAPKDVLSVGRAGENDLVLALDPAVSARHARIVREGEHFWLEDVGSRNGTFLGDQVVERRVLIGSGTTFRVGRTQLEFLT
jgi:pSer/pThr/pTyr-binding forkhead associated (FHA) protein